MPSPAILSLKLLCASGAILLSNSAFPQAPSVPDVNKTADQAENGTSAQGQALAELKAQLKILTERVTTLQATLAKKDAELAEAKAQKNSRDPKSSPQNPATSGAAEPVAEPAAEPAAEPVAEPITEPIAEPVAEPVATDETIIAVNAAEPTARLITSDPFESPETFIVEIAQRYAERFGITPTLTPARTLDFDDFSVNLSRWTVGQNRILCQPVEWSVRVLRTEPSKKSSDKFVLICQAVTADGVNIGDPFHAEMDWSPTSELIRSNPKETIFHLAGVIDPRLEFSAEHAKAGPWHRDGIFVAPYCASHWLVVGTQLTVTTNAPAESSPESSPESNQASSEPVPSVE